MTGLPSNARNEKKPLTSSSEEIWLKEDLRTGLPDQVNGGEPSRVSRGREPFVLILEKVVIVVVGKIEVWAYMGS